MDLLNLSFYILRLDLSGEMFYLIIFCLSEPQTLLSLLSSCYLSPALPFHGKTRPAPSSAVGLSFAICLDR